MDTTVNHAEIKTFDSTSDVWKRFNVEYASLINDLMGFKTQFWTSCGQAGIRVFLDVEDFRLFSIGNLKDLKIALRIITNGELAVDIYLEMFE